jgi:hypothetical protein
LVKSPERALGAAPVEPARHGLPQHRAADDLRGIAFLIGQELFCLGFRIAPAPNVPVCAAEKFRER